MLHYDSNDTVLYASLYSWDLSSSLNKYADYYPAVLSLNLSDFFDTFRRWWSANLSSSVQNSTNKVKLTQIRSKSPPQLL